MRAKERWILFGFACAVLAALASLSLVERPALLQEAQETAPVSSPAAMWQAQAPALPEGTEENKTAQARAERSSAADCPAIIRQGGRAPARDGNGCPLHGMRFIRARYQAFPQEDMPG